jgi:pimeloyl-ACP methyl ester carboxylesterase
MADGAPSHGALRGELGALLMQARLMAGGTGSDRGRLSAQRAVIFVHGLWATGPVFEPMRRAVEARAGLPGLPFTYSSVSTFERVTTRFARFVDTHVPKACRVSIVGHSLGGLIARWYVQEQGGSDRVDRLVLLATPSAGTARAVTLPGALHRALRPDSPVLRRLGDSQARARGIPHRLIVAGGDWLVRPPGSAASLGPGSRCDEVTGGEPGDVHVIDAVGHNEMLFDPRVHELVIDALPSSCGRAS